MLRVAGKMLILEPSAKNTTCSVCSNSLVVLVARALNAMSRLIRRVVGQE